MENKGLSMKEMSKKVNGDKLLRIGELAKLTGEPTPTLNYWTTLGLLKSVDRTEKGYRLYSIDAVRAVKEIRKRQQKKKRFTLAEMRQDVMDSRP